MKIMRFFRSLAAVAAALGLCLLGWHGTVLASGQGETAGNQETETASLKIYFGTEQEGFPGIELRLYRVAELNDSGTGYVLSDNFKSYQVSLEELDSSGWRELSQTLYGYIMRDGIAPEARTETDVSGWADFGQREKGLYLVEGDSFREEDLQTGGVRNYTPEPFFVSLPGFDESGVLDWDIQAVCKYVSEYIPPEQENETVTRKVLKIWKDKENLDKRPEEIKVQLLKDGVVEDTVTLNAANNWRYTWTDLEEGPVWLVTEYEVPEGYTVSAVREGITFVITNTLAPEGTDKEEPGDNPEKDKPSGGDSGGKTSNGGGRPSARPLLPQTGVLRWPVPVLAGCGLALFLVGWRKQKGRKSVKKKAEG